MLGIEDPWVYWAYILNIFAVILCVVYGLKNWNKGHEQEQEEIEEEIEWEKTEQKIDEQL